MVSMMARSNLPKEKSVIVVHLIKIKGEKLPSSPENAKKKKTHKSTYSRFKKTTHTNNKGTSLL